MSQQRADTVKQALVYNGVDSSRLEKKGYGNSHPVANNNTEEGRAENRRIDILITQK